MNAALETLGRAVLAPAAVAWMACALACRLRSPQAARYGAALALVAAYSTGYVLLHSWAEIVPARHWHWTLWLTLLAGTIGPVAAAEGLRRGERWLLIAWVSVPAGFLLTPDWPKLWPPRTFCIPLLAAYLFALGTLLEGLAPRFSPRAWLAHLSLSAVGVAALIAAFVSLTYAQTAAVAAAALAGCWVAACWPGRASAVRGLALGYAVLVGGWAFVGCIEPRAPLWGLLLAPAAPLALVGCAWGPLSRLRGAKALAAQATCVLLALTLAAALCEFLPAFQNPH